MQKTMKDPTDVKGERVITLKDFQENKANVFFDAAQKSIIKHYTKYCEEYLFLSLYGESCGSQLVAKLLLNNSIATGQDVYFHSSLHDRNIIMYDFGKFLEERVDVLFQKDNIHTNKCSDILPLLAGELVHFNIRFAIFLL